MSTPNSHFVVFSTKTMCVRYIYCMCLYDHICSLTCVCASVLKSVGANCKCYRRKLSHSGGMLQKWRRPTMCAQNNMSAESETVDRTRAAARNWHRKTCFAGRGALRTRWETVTRINHKTLPFCIYVFLAPRIIKLGSVVWGRGLLLERSACGWQPKILDKSLSRWLLKNSLNQVAREAISARPKSNRKSMFDSQRFFMHHKPIGDGNFVQTNKRFTFLKFKP